jgi:protein-arginine kinase activator protein McsA
VKTFINQARTCHREVPPDTTKTRQFFFSYLSEVRKTHIQYKTLENGSAGRREEGLASLTPCTKNEKNEVKRPFLIPEVRKTHMQCKTLWEWFGRQEGGMRCAACGTTYSSYFACRRIAHGCAHGCRVYCVRQTHEHVYRALVGV